MVAGGGPEALETPDARYSWGPAALALVAVLGGTYLRLAGALETPLYGDEYHAMRTAGEELGAVLATFDELGSHVALPLLQWLGGELFGRGLLSARLPALVPGVLALPLLYFVARGLVGRAPAALCTLALALSPMHVYYSRFGRSYALGVFLGLALLGAVNLRPGRWRSVGIVVLSGLLPYVHLASTGYVLALALAAVLVPGSARASARQTLALFGGGALLAAALYAPVREPLWEYLTTRGGGPRDRPTSLVGVPLLLGGGAAGMVALLVGVPLGLAALGTRERRTAALLAAALVGPLAFLLATRPHGMEYAWSRYLLMGLPAAWMLAALAWTHGTGTDQLGSASRLGLPLGALLLVAGAALGPGLGTTRVQGAPFTNTYLALRELPAFDARDPGASRLYEQLAADAGVTRIAEAPDLSSRALLLYRNHQLAHGKQVLLGIATSREDSRLGPGPYVFMSRNACRAAGVDVLVLHKDLTAELEHYWSFVFKDAWPDLRRLGDAGLMQRHRTYFMPPGDSAAYAASLRPTLENRFGTPFFEDPHLVAWRVQ